jgi:thiamine biosynthesis lipoprotein
MARHLAISLFVLFTALASFGPADSPSLERFTFREPHMGTQVRLVLYAPDRARAQAAAKAAFARIAELDGIMSDYRPASELMRLCKKAGGEPIEVSADLFRIIEKAQEAARRSAGAFDVTVGPLVRLWRRARRTRQLPSAQEIKKALDLVGYEKIKLDPLRRTVQLLVMGMLLDLGGIAKGYAADAALETLARHGIRQALVALGGDIRVGAAPPGTRGWKIGIAPLKKPDAEPEHYLLLENAAVSTAGDAEQAAIIHGRRYSHIIDPRTGMGQLGRRSATVIAGDGTTADALDTAFCVLGPEKGLRMIEEVQGAAALYVYEKDGKILTVSSSRFSRYNLKSNGKE